MSRKATIICLILVTIVGSLFMMLASNMFFNIVVHVGGGFDPAFVFPVLPAMSVTMAFVLGILYLLRTYRHPDCRRRITRCYSIILAVISLIGLIGAILAGAVFYKNFVGSKPFPGYVLIFLILNLLLVCGSCAIFFLAKRLPQDEGRVKIGFRYVMKTLGWFLFICLLLNRFGTFLTSPSFIYWRNFQLTFPFYLYLLLPVFLGVLVSLHILGIGNRKKLFILGIVALGLNVVFFAYTAIMGINDTGFISSLSQAMPLERVASKPVELPIHFLAYAGVAAAVMVQNRKPKGE